MASLDEHKEPLGEVHAQHLIKRASFKYTKQMVNDIKLLTPKDAIDYLLSNSGLVLEKPYDPEPLTTPDGYFTDITYTSNTKIKKGIIVSGWWWYNAVKRGTLNYKICHFLSTRFTVDKKSGSPEEFYDHLRILLYYSDPTAKAVRSFRDLAKRMCLDNTMSDYLGNTENTAERSNENFAREFLELFTIGKGPQKGEGDYTNYTDKDVVEAAKVLTGIRRVGNRSVIDDTDNIPKAKYVIDQHNQNDKTFSSAFNNTIIIGAKKATKMGAELTDFVEMVFSQKETARHFCRKLYTYFVRSEITQEVEDEIIIPLAKDFKAEGYEILPTVRKLLQSKHFYDLDDSNSDDEIIGGMIKSPLQLISEIFTYLGCELTNSPENKDKSGDFYIHFWNRFAHNTFFESSNMSPFAPESVAGHAAYSDLGLDKLWVSSSTLISRYRVGESLIAGKNIINGNADIRAKIDIVKVIKDSGIVSSPSDADILCTELCNALFGKVPSKERVDYFKNTFILKDAPNKDKAYWSQAWLTYISTNDNSAVKPRLEDLLKNILSAPEFQLF